MPASVPTYPKTNLVRHIHFPENPPQPSNLPTNAWELFSRMTSDDHSSPLIIPSATNLTFS